MKAVSGAACTSVESYRGCGCSVSYDTTSVARDADRCFVLPTRCGPMESGIPRYNGMFLGTCAPHHIHLQERLKSQVDLASLADMGM